MNSFIKTAGANFEGGKIIKHMTRDSNCKFTSNIQIGMDAPFFGEPAGTDIREKGPSERQFGSYDRNIMIRDIKKCFNKANEIMTQNRIVDLVVQIARGRNGLIFLQDDILPVLQSIFMISNTSTIDLNEPNIQNYNFANGGRLYITFGYRTTDYFDYTKMINEYIFMNIGMFARLTENLTAGQVCIPSATYDVVKNGMDLTVHAVNYNYFDFCFNLGLMHINLFGIADNMPFITTDDYTLEDFMELINNNYQ
ncbi:unnamed protein product [Didymodactylos carnosus]|uniref:Uncharacterized protein n=1 Tax=Didymodactylos carnosus TaxID=1234261 RepID=A0A814LMI0_9BILA|nr:unnamed protein product [Didymodactylos carnosus]CAF1106651.1 unnamed protein product [Didymodactylos carnosus]CAF3833829.1 unnamed protein product [Didymodactylos carnosus]CAF3870664.1 unnamed protein product [Didymodactylos carnosus]